MTVGSIPVVCCYINRKEKCYMMRNRTFMSPPIVGEPYEEPGKEVPSTFYRRDLALSSCVAGY